MKRFMLGTLLAITSTVALADTQPTTTAGPQQTLPWVLRAPGDVWRIANPQGKVNVSFTVSPSINNVPADPVALTCNGNRQVIAAGKTGNCTATGFSQPTFQIAIFKNGSQGAYTAS